MPFSSAYTQLGQASVRIKVKRWWLFDMQLGLARRLIQAANTGSWPHENRNIEGQLEGNTAKLQLGQLPCPFTRPPLKFFHLFCLEKMFEGHFWALNELGWLKKSINHGIAGSLTYWPISISEKVFY